MNWRLYHRKKLKNIFRNLQRNRKSSKNKGKFREIREIKRKLKLVKISIFKLNHLIDKIIQICVMVLMHDIKKLYKLYIYFHIDYYIITYL
jgi:hypothetical protein